MEGLILEGNLVWSPFNCQVTVSGQGGIHKVSLGSGESLFNCQVVSKTPKHRVITKDINRRQLASPRIIQHYSFDQYFHGLGWLNQHSHGQVSNLNLTSQILQGCYAVTPGSRRKSGKEKTANTRVLMGGRWREECFFKSFKLIAFPYPQTVLGQYPQVILK